MQARLDETRILDGSGRGCAVASQHPVGDLLDVACEAGLDSAAVQLAEDAAPVALVDALANAVEVGVFPYEDAHGREWHELLGVGI